jgi:glucose/arabinose dehydrogenase
MARILSRLSLVILVIALLFALQIAFTSRLKPLHDTPDQDHIYLPVVSKNPPVAPPQWRTLFRVKEQGAILSSVTRAPDGTLYFATKRGQIYMHSKGNTTLFLDMTSEVSSVFDRGLNAIAASPDGRYLFVFYVRDAPGQTPDVLDERDLVLERISVVNPELRQQILKGIPSTSITHTAGMLKFGRDNELFIGIGDDALNEDDAFKLYALDIDQYYGKVLRIDSTTGGGLPGNPFWNGDPYSVRSKVYALGFRNPFSGFYDQNTGQLFVGDVGEQQWEEVNLVLPGHNYGWPCYEGNAPYLYQGCFDVPRKFADLTWPMIVYPHDCETAVTGMARWEGRLLVSDYGCGTIKDWTNPGRPDTLWKFQYVTSILPLPNDELIALQMKGSSGQFYGEVMIYSSNDVYGSAGPAAPVYNITIEQIAVDTYRARALAQNGADVSEQVEWNAVIHHDAHVHPDYARGTGAVFKLVRSGHPEGWIELCASLGASAACIRVD